MEREAWKPLTALENPTWRSFSSLKNPSGIFFPPFPEFNNLNSSLMDFPPGFSALWDGIPAPTCESGWFLEKFGKGAKFPALKKYLENPNWLDPLQYSFGKKISTPNPWNPFPNNSQQPKAV